MLFKDRAEAGKFLAKADHPSQPEYAIAATAENGHIVGSSEKLTKIDEKRKFRDNNCF